MSTQHDYVDPSISDETVADFLAEDPGFFERNPKLLSNLRLPHVTGGTVSLVERQLSVLRQREIKLEKQLKELIGVARDNDALASKIHAFAIHLLAATDLPSTVKAVEEAMRAGFAADNAVLVLFADPDAIPGLGKQRFLRLLSREDKALAPFSTFLKSNAPRCGQARDAQLEFLFHGDASDIGSVAMVPLGPESEFGFLSIGSHDRKRFHPGMSIDFLARIGELVTEAIKRH